MKSVSLFLTTLLISLMFCSCEIEDVDFKGIENFKVLKQDMDDIVVRFDMRVNNPNKFNIKIAKTSLDIYINGNKVGKAKMKEGIKILKKKEDAYPVYLKTNGKDVMKGMMGSLGSLFGGDVKVRIKGNVKAKVYGIGKKFEIDEEQSVDPKGLF